MRSVPVFVALVALVSCAGCSLIWDMDRYEGAARAGRDGGQTSSSGSSGVPITPADDAGRGDGAAQIGCRVEVEPNDTRDTATDLTAGRTCGTLDDARDLDYWSVTATEEVTVTVTITEGMQIVVMPESGGPSVIQVAGASNITLGAGAHLLLIQTFDGGFGDYEIAR